MRAPSIVLFFLLLSSEVFAFRNAIFAVSLKPRTTLWYDQDRIFTAETESEKERPIWVHGGDSVGVGWGTQITLGERLAMAEAGEIPEAGTLRDLVSHYPSARYTWYAGSEINFGLLGFLERELSIPWVVVSSALAGAKLSAISANALDLMMQTQHPERVKLLTFSMGGNDVCENLDPARDPAEFQKKLSRLTKTFPLSTQIVPFDVPDMLEIRNLIMSRLEKLPDTPGKEKILSYCRKMWDEINCPALVQQPPERISGIRNRIRSSYIHEWGALFDPFSTTTQETNVLEYVSGDCFHPSRNSQTVIRDLLQQYLKSRNFPQR